MLVVFLFSLKKRIWCCGLWRIANAGSGVWSIYYYCPVNHWLLSKAATLLYALEFCGHEFRSRRGISLLYVASSGNTEVVVGDLHSEFGVLWRFVISMSDSWTGMIQCLGLTGNNDNHFQMALCHWVSHSPVTWFWEGSFPEGASFSKPPISGSPSSFSGGEQGFSGTEGVSLVKPFHMEF